MKEYTKNDFTNKMIVINQMVAINNIITSLQISLVEDSQKCNVEERKKLEELISELDKNYYSLLNVKGKYLNFLENK